MLRVCIRFFRKKSPLLEASHRYTLPKTRSKTGVLHKSELLDDPGRLKKLQKLVEDHTHIPGLSLSESVKKLAKTDKEFNDFLKTFKSEKEPEWSSLIDSPAQYQAKNFFKDPKKKAQDRLDQLHMQDQLRKKLIAQKLSKDYKDLKNDGQQKKGKINIFDNKLGQEKLIGQKIYFNHENFRILFLDASTTTNITKLARVSSRRVLLYMGNTDGVISYGKGKGSNYKLAYDNAVEELKKNIICINLDSYKTTTGYLVGHFNDTTVQIFSARNNAAWGHPLHYNILALAGLTNFRFRLHSRNLNYYSLIYSFFNCLVTNQTPRQIAQRYGQKIYQMGYGRGLRRDYDPSLFNVI
jgi:ribosomal protein S5